MGEQQRVPVCLIAQHGWRADDSFRRQDFVKGVWRILRLMICVEDDISCLWERPKQVQDRGHGNAS